MFTVSKPIQDRAIVTVEMPVGNRRLSIEWCLFHLAEVTSELDFKIMISF